MYLGRVCHNKIIFGLKVVSDLNPIKVISILKEITKFLRASLPSTIEIRYGLKTKNDVIMADPTQIHQVLMNLCTNAGHAMKGTGGVLEVILDSIHLTDEDLITYTDLKSGPYLKLTVSDTGHGIGREMHEEPKVPNFVSRELLANDIVLAEGMILAVEPMINIGTHKVIVADDGWTVITADKKPSAHFEHSISIFDGKTEILSVS